jgi:hypothetical protein
MWGEAFFGLDFFCSFLCQDKKEQANSKMMQDDI